MKRLLFILIALVIAKTAVADQQNTALHIKQVGDSIVATDYGIPALGNDGTDHYGVLSGTGGGSSSTNRKNPSSTPTVTAATTNYTAGDCVGGKMTVASAFTTEQGTIKRVVAVDEGAEAQDLDVVIFNADPSGSTFTDNAACAINDADLTKIVAIVPLRQHYAFSTEGASMASTDIPLNTGGTSFYAVAIARGSGYYYDATDALSFIFDIESD